MYTQIFYSQLLRPNVSLGNLVYKDMSFETTQICVQSPVLPLTSYVALDNLLTIS